MNCAACDYENPADAAFCEECGAKLESVCPSCGGATTPGAKFCRKCGTSMGGRGSRPSIRPQEKAAIRDDRGGTPTAPSSGPSSGPRIEGRSPLGYTPKHLADKILQSKSALEGERKQVTVLFADVKGSMELAEQLDPEAFSTIMQRVFGILSDGVERFEGFVDKFTGDGIMALFGAPIAHEDHAQRACYAALHLREEIKRYADELRRTEGVNLSARIGLNSGEVVVGTIGKSGDNLRMDYTAQGHTVGLAQRMELRAAADSTYLTAHTARLVEGYVQLRDLGEFDLKGVSAPLRAHELLGLGAVRTRLDASRSRGFSKFIGRDREMRMLETALERSLIGEAQIVGVVGEAGVGKSRLCAEFLDHCRARSIAVYEAHCLSHGDALPFLPVLQLFRGYFGIRESDPPAEARRRIAGTLLLLDERFREVLPLLFDFLGVPDPEHPLPLMNPEVRQRHLLALTSDLLRARSAREPAVLLLDDLHWIDRSSEAVLGQLGHDWAERSGDPGVLARVLDAQATVLSAASGSRAAPQVLLEQAMALAERTTDRSLQVGLHQRMTWLLLRTASASELLVSAERGIALAGNDVTLGVDVIGWSSLIFMLQMHAFALLFLGRLPEALQGAAHAERLALEHDDVPSIFQAWHQKAVLAVAQGEPDTGRMAALRVVEMAERIGMPVYFAQAHSALATALVECGQWGDALMASERGAAILRNELAGTAIDLDLGLHDAAARALLGAGEVEPARAAADEMLALCARVPDLGFPRTFAYLGAGHVLLRTDGPASPTANDALERTARLIEEFHTWSLRPQLHLEYAERARLLGDTASAQHHLREAHQLFTAMGATGHAARLSKELGL